MVMCPLRRAFFVFFSFSTTLYPQIGRRNGGVVLHERTRMPIFDISKLEELPNSLPPTSMLTWAGKNPVFVEFLNVRSGRDERDGVFGRYSVNEKMTVYTCQDFESLKATIVHEYAHHLQWLNYKAKNKGWSQDYYFVNDNQDRLFEKWYRSAPLSFYLTAAPHEMAAEAFRLIHGYKQVCWDASVNWNAPPEFVEDWTLFFMSQPYFKETI